MVFSRCLLLACLSMALGYMQPVKNLKSMPVRAHLISGNEEVPATFYPFAEAGISTTSVAPSAPKALDMSLSRRVSSFTPAVAMAVFFGIASDADATVDAITAPLHGIELYSR